MAKRKRRVFSDEYKTEVVELVRKSGRSIGAVAKQLDLTETRGSPEVLTTAERDELRDRGKSVSRKRVTRLMRIRGLRALAGRRRAPRATDSRHGPAIAENRLRRNFRTEAPNRVWVGDVTYLPTMEGWLFLPVLLDLFPRRIVGYALSEKNDQTLARAALPCEAQDRYGRGLCPGGPMEEAKSGKP